MNRKSTRLGSEVLAAKFSHRGNDDYELLKDFADVLASNSKTFKVLFGFQGLFRSRKKIGTFFKDFQGSVATLCKAMIS